MRRLLPSLLLLLALVFQNASAVSAAVASDASPSEHCQGHQSDDCSCCPEGAMAALGCATQCASLQEAPALMPVIVRIGAESRIVAFTPRLIRNPIYTPLIPPPIA